MLKTAISYTAIVMLFTIALAAGSPTSPGGEEHPRRRQVIAFAKRVDVRTLDRRLPSERLDRFLARVLPSGTKIVWTSSDCENKPPTFPRPAETPLCASIRANVRARSLHFEIQVGTHAVPIVGKPRIEKLYILGAPSTENAVQDLTSLSDLLTAFR